jgi:HSP20 family protein
MIGSVMDVVEAPPVCASARGPGIHKENLDINLTGNLLTITGKREMTPEVEGEGHLVKERAIGKFVRTIRLPAPVAEKKVVAEYRDGVLMVRIPKETPAAATKILIK